MTSNCVYISAKIRLLNKNLILRQARAQNCILCDSFTEISNTRYRRMVKSDFQLDDFLVDAASILYRIKCSLCSVGMPCQICVKLRTFLVAMISLVLSILVGAAISHFSVYFLVLKIRFKTCINGLIYKNA